jgi:putative ABC transport system ATP-binding protein
VDVHALRGVSLDVHEGEFVAIMGPSGCGKSTMLHLLGGLLTPTSGRIIIDEEDLTAASDAARTDIRRRKIGFVFQRFNLFPTLTAEGNLRLAERIQSDGKGDDPERRHEVLRLLRLEDKMHHKPLELSGGEQQRVALARAVVTRPAIILADEPTGNLDSENSAIVLNMFQELNYRFNQTIIMITHNPEAPFAGTDVAQMASDGERFQVAVLQGDTKYRRFVRGTNSSVYPKLETGGGGEADCGGGGEKKRAMTEQRTVGALSGLRPQHFTDALLVRPVASDNSTYIYARSETFAEEQDDRKDAGRNARVVRGYYILDELAPEGNGRARLSRRFWFDRFGTLRLARLQTFDANGSIATDVVYREPKSFGDAGRYNLPSRIELTRPQDRYSIQISYQTPGDVKTDEAYKPEIFVLQNRWQLPETDLDSRTQQSVK